MVREWLRGRHEEDEAAESTAVRALSSAPRPDKTEREQQLHGLALLSLFLHSTATVQEMMSRLLEQAATATGALLVYPLLLERRRQALRASMLEGCADDSLNAAMDAFQEDLTALEFPLVPNHELYSILEEGEIVIRDSFGVLMDGVLPEEQWRAGEQALHVRRLAFAPMVVENEPLGLVVFAFDNDNLDIEVLELLVGHLTLALRDLLVRDEAVRFSDVDPVTWVSNRRYLQQALESEIARAGRYGRALSLVTLDIDGFAEFNRNYGQTLGDRLLRTVATTLAETVSPPEIVARLRDDDFVVLLPETSRASAVTATTRLLAALAHVNVFSDNEAGERITASVAIACFPEDAATPHALLQRAAADLEAAKRDRVPAKSAPRAAAAGGGTA